LFARGRGGTTCSRGRHLVNLFLFDLFHLLLFLIGLLFVGFLLVRSFESTVARPAFGRFGRALNFVLISLFFVFFLCLFVCLLCRFVCLLTFFFIFFLAAVRMGAFRLAGTHEEVCKAGLDEDSGGGQEVM